MVDSGSGSKVKMPNVSLKVMILAGGLTVAFLNPVIRRDEKILKLSG